MEKNKIIRLIISICLSIGLWVYVINVVNPTSSTVIRNIPVILENEDTLASKGLAIMGSGEYTVDITVNAPRTDLGVISADNFVANADVSALTMGQDYITVSVTGPKGYNITEIRSRKIQVYVDELSSREVPVVVNCSAAANGYEACVLSTYPETIEITGAKQLIENVECYTVVVDTEKELAFEQETTLTKTGYAQNESGGTILGVKTATKNIDVKATIFAQKKVKLFTQYTGTIWTGASLVGTKSPETLIVKGSTENLATVSELTSKKISIDGIYEDLETEITVNLPTGIYLSDENLHPTFVADIADSGSIEFTYSLNDIEVQGLSADYSASLAKSEDKYFTATVTGPVKILKTLSSKDITLSVDASSITAEGTKDVKINTGSQIGGISISVNPSQTVLTIRKR